jgi:prephenate dehydrogenase
MKTVAIAGVGLIGGSFGLALRQAGYTGTIAGVSSPATIAKALERRIIDCEMTLEQAAQSADLLFLAQPISRILTAIEEIAPVLGKNTLVTDAGSTKALICRTAAQHLPPDQFAGGHPMAGKETRGAESADGSLFRGRTWVLTRPIDHPFAGWIERIGASILILDPEEHDRAVAFTSHLPQLLSSALAATVGSHLPNEQHLRAGGPGLIDMTRLALSPYDIWSDILETNQAPVGEALGAMIARLEEMRTRLQTGQLRADFDSGAALRRKLVSPVRWK